MTTTASRCVLKSQWGWEGHPTPGRQAGSDLSPRRRSGGRADTAVRPSVHSRCNSSSRPSNCPKTDWCARGPHTSAGWLGVYRELDSQPLGSRATVDLIGRVLHDRRLLRDLDRVPTVRLMRSRLLPLAAAGCTCSTFLLLAAPRARANRDSVAGARATLVAYVAAVIAGNGTTACSLLTPAIRKQLAKADHQSNCETVIETAAELLKSRPTQATQLRSYASTAKVTLRGDTATVPIWSVAAGPR